MGCSETEMAEQTLPMNPDAAKNRKSNGSTKQARGKQQQQQQQQQQQPRNKPAEVFQKLSHSPYGLCNKGREKLTFNVKNVSLVLNVILTIIIIGISISITTLLGRSCEVLPTAQPSPSTPTECCPEGWIGYQRQCYYFSDSDRNWTYSQNYCASFNASLVVIDSQEEMSFLRRYTGPFDHWIGLERIDDQELWIWINGTIFNNWHDIRGGGTYAHLNHQGITSASRASEERWICRKPVGK